MGTLSLKTWHALIVAVVAAVLVVALASNRHTISDPDGTLLVAQAIVDHRTVQLDVYEPDLSKRLLYQIHRKNDHTYHYFPIGTSLASLPFVAIARRFGFDAAHDEGTLQIVLCGLIAALTMLVSFAIARQFLAPGWALCLAMVFWFGTSLASTGGTALWSHNTATLLAATAIWLSLRACFAGAFQAWPLIALTLFLAYLCRPTLALLSPLLLAAIVLFDWKTALRTMLLDAGLLLLFVLWSLHEFGQMLPDYYLPKRLSSEDPWLAVYGNLLSPARGLLVYSPFLAVGLAFLVGFRASSRRHWLVLSIGLAWPAVHLVAISRFPHWWGGHSFGSRLTMDILPGLLVLVAASWAELRFRRIAACALAPLIAFSVFVHSYQGLYNGFVTRWNGEPDIDLFPVYLFDWKYPQFLHDEHRHLRRLAEFHATRVASLVPGDHVGPTSTHLAFVDWSEPISGRRTSKALHPWILFKVDDATMFRGGLTIWLSADEPHAVALQLNDRTLGVFAVGRDVTPISVPENGLPIHHGINVIQLRRLDGMGSGSRAFGSGSIRFNSIALE